MNFPHDETGCDGDQQGPSGSMPSHCEAGPYAQMMYPMPPDPMMSMDMTPPGAQVSSCKAESSTSSGGSSGKKPKGEQNILTSGYPGPVTLGHASAQFPFVPEFLSLCGKTNTWSRPRVTSFGSATRDGVGWEATRGQTGIQLASLWSPRCPVACA